MSGLKLDRRAFMLQCSGAAGWGFLATHALRAQGARMHLRPIPRTGEMLPVVGLGTSDEFEFVPDEGDQELKAVISTLVAQGGTIIDTAPGYGEAEALLGRWLTELSLKQRVFLCSKVSTLGRERGLELLARTQALLSKEPVDLLQVHSLRDVHTQVENLRHWKDSGRVRYIGITTYRGTDYDVVEDFVKQGHIDFIQVDYSVVQTLAQERVIPAAADHGVAVMINSAFGNGAYFSRLRGKALPDWAAEFECESWAQFSLKYILGQAGVTSVLAATSDPRHMLDNARAGMGALPDAAMRHRMAEHMRTV
jgi:aryl-alcohol dehydrogenase-like predicted oxidoreductase